MSSDRAVTRRDLILAILVTAILGTASTLGWTGFADRPIADLALRSAQPRWSGASPIIAVLIDDPSIERFETIPWSRPTLALLVEHIAAADPRVIAIDMLLSEAGDEQGDLALELALGSVDTVLAAVLDSKGEWLLPLDRFGGARAAGHAHGETDVDGIVRSISFSKQSAGLALPALSIAAVRQHGWDGPIVPGRSFRPDFRQAPREIPHISAAALLSRPRDFDRALSDHIVFLGYSGAGTTDQLVVPVREDNRLTPGVLVHAAAASSLLRGALLKPTPLWSTFCLVFAIALSLQLLRNRSGHLRISNLLLVVSVVITASMASLWIGLLQLPTGTLILAAILAAGLREADESKQAQREIGAILAALMSEEGLVENRRVPRGAQGRLELVRTLQDRIARDRDLRRRLLEGMNEGVALWDRSGHLLLSNRATSELWGHAPALPELKIDLAVSSEGDSCEILELERSRRQIAVEVIELADGHLGLFRDVTERSELDRRRREVHRLVSHELKTPLASISGFGEMLQTYDMSAEELHKVAGLIRNEADRLGEMVRGFLDIERLASSEWDARMAPLDLAAMVDDRSHLLTPVAATRSKTIVVDHSAVALINGVEELIPQLIDNLLSNAIKYSEDGSEIRVELETTAAGEVSLSVLDRGPGIPPEALPRLFERFYRVPGTEAPGSGLGLALVKEVADRHGASIEVDSEQGKGSRFRVLFPGIGALK